MNYVKLYTADGGFVVEVCVPPFTVMPTVITWGSRSFVWSKEYQRYCEAFVYAALYTAGEHRGEVVI